VVSLISSGSSLLHATNKLAAVHREIVFAAVDASGAIAVIVFILAGTTVVEVVVAIGHMELATIHVVVKAFLTALFVFSIKLEVLLH
jgi:hypothetical protein